MNDWQLTHNEIPQAREFSSQVEYQHYGYDTVINEANALIADTQNLVNGLTAESRDTGNIREYGLKDCVDATKQIFTPEIISEWGNLKMEQRQQIMQEYSKAIGEGLNIDFKGVLFEKMDARLAGFNQGDGYVHLNENLLKNPSQIVKLIDTVAHEARHQFQFEAMKNPEKYGIDPATVNEWTAGLKNYTTQYATEYDPWGYFYNPVETDARYFGESVVRELTRDLINQRNDIAGKIKATGVSQVTFGSVSSELMIDAKYDNKNYEKSIKKAEDAIAKGDYDMARWHNNQANNYKASEKYHRERALREIGKK